LKGHPREEDENYSREVPGDADTKGTGIYLRRYPETLIRRVNKKTEDKKFNLLEVNGCQR